MNRVMSYLMCVMAMAGFAGCSDSNSDDSGGGGNMNGKTLKLQKMNLDGAKYLSLTGNNTRAAGDDEVGLFKIDEQGNMTTVVVSCTEEEDGTVTRTRTDIKVTPRSICSLSGIFTFMGDCSFTDGEGRSVGMLQYYEPGAYSFNILVRNSDGAIFYIPKSLSETYFRSANEGHSNTVTDGKGNLYLFGGGNLGMVTVRNGQLVLTQVNPNGVEVGGGNILPFDNGTVMTYRADDNMLACTFLYPNGGFEEYCGYRVIETFADGGYSDETILPAVLKVKSGTKAVMVKGIHREGLSKEYIVSLCDFRVGTSYGDHSLSAPIASLSSGTDYSTYDPQAPDYLDWVAKYQAASFWLNGIYETTNKYIIGRTLVVDKRTMEMRPLEGTESNIIFPNAGNTYKGLAWNVGSWGAEWYDMETMQYGKVDFNLPSDFQISKETADIPSGKLILYGTRYADGKSVTYFVDIETGSYVCTESDSERPIVALIPLN